MNNPDFYIITGASGAGKSTLIAALRELGHSTVPEAALEVMRAHPKYSGKLIPPSDRAVFMEKVLDRSILDHEAAQSMKPPVFFDRGIPEWLRFVERDVKLRYMAASQCSYAGTVFLAEPWPEIYVNDNERIASFERAARSYDQTVSAYIEAGFKTCVIPKVSVHERAVFILERVGECTMREPNIELITNEK
ncbi:AAA family ATPase [Neptunicella sp. SCSIO 80796]|uniref:AAA family ATPase n=1 Tax=Neptunicella plasticusilytica TaxID=3117012 RepID=UPI003A4DB771